MSRKRFFAVAALLCFLGQSAAGQSQGSSGGTVPANGPANINVNNNAATNINTGTSTANVTLGGASNAVILPGVPGFSALCLTAAGGTGIGNCAVGTWTPTVTTDGTAGTPAYTTQVGSWDNLGRFIRASFTIVLSGWTGTPTGNILIAGLPFTSANNANDNGGCTITKYTVTGLAASNVGITGFIPINSTQIQLFSGGNTGTTQITQAQAGSTATLIGVCQYHS